MRACAISINTRGEVILQDCWRDEGETIQGGGGVNVRLKFTGRACERGTRGNDTDLQGGELDCYLHRDKRII
jgi:hypothetical protein